MTALYAESGASDAAADGEVGPELQGWLSPAACWTKASNNNMTSVGCGRQ